MSLGAQLGAERIQTAALGTTSVGATSIPAASAVVAFSVIANMTRGELWPASGQESSQGQSVQEALNWKPAQLPELDKS